MVFYLGHPRSIADVHADETSIRQINIEKRAYIWDFVTPDLIVYCYAPSRSGDTPNRIRGDSQGPVRGAGRSLSRRGRRSAMNEPKRLLDSGSGHLRALVEAGKGDQPDRHLQEKVLGALGLGAASGAGLIAGAPDALARSGIARFFGGLRHAALSKTGIGVIAAATVSSAGYLAVSVHERAREVATRSATSVAPAAAPVPLRPLAPQPSAASTTD
jgi:hypothetical protein